MLTAGKRRRSTEKPAPARPKITVIGTSSPNATFKSGAEAASLRVRRNWANYQSAAIQQVVAIPDGETVDSPS